MTDKSHPLTSLRVSGQQKHPTLLVRRWRGKFVNAEQLGQVPQFFMHEPGIEAQFERVSGKFLNITIASLMIYWGPSFYSFSVRIDVFCSQKTPSLFDQLHNYKSNPPAQRLVTSQLASVMWHRSCSLGSVSSISITQLLILRWFDYSLSCTRARREWESESVELVNYRRVSFHKVGDHFCK